MPSKNYSKQNQLTQKAQRPQKPQKPQKAPQKPQKPQKKAKHHALRSARGTFVAEGGDSSERVSNPRPMFSMLVSPSFLARLDTLRAYHELSRSGVLRLLVLEASEELARAHRMLNTPASPYNAVALDGTGN